MAFSAKAQSNFSISTDLQSRYVWRGMALGGSAPSIQPSATYSYKGLSVGTWGAFSMCTSAYQELDLSLNYSFCKDMFSVGLIDYSFPIYESNYNYFDYPKNHILEAGISFKGTKNIPLTLALFTNICGADSKDNSDKRAYSSYAEVGYSLTCQRIESDFSFFCGCALNGAKTNSFYGNKKFAAVNLGASGVKKLKINDGFSLPLKATLAINPNSKKAYFVIGTGIAL